VILTAPGVAAAVATYHDGSALETDLSPRPYLHPVRTPAGAEMTETCPADHRHHYGVSAAVVDVDGVTYWGGKSFVLGQGYTMLANHGRQDGSAPSVTTDADRTVLQQQLSWTGPDGEEQLVEDREVRLSRIERGGPVNLLTWRSELHAPHRDLTIGSPATRGRTGAGYGGLFWRLGPESPTTVRVSTADGVVSGEESALGAVGPWLTLTQVRDGGPVTLLLGQPTRGEHDPLPWFVRVGGYVGAGPAVAWETPVPFVRGTSRSLHLWAALVDADIEPVAADALYRDLEDLAA
jgi:LacI family transcriptional regulator